MKLFGRPLDLLSVAPQYGVPSRILVAQQCNTASATDRYNKHAATVQLEKTCCADRCTVDGAATETECAMVFVETLVVRATGAIDLVNSSSAFP